MKKVINHSTMQAAIMVGACFAATMISREAMAITAPTTGSFAYDIYNIGVNNILKGPIGFVGGVGAVVAGAVMAIRQMLLPAIATIISGGFLLKADSVVTSMGAMVS